MEEIKYSKSAYLFPVHDRPSLKCPSGGGGNSPDSPEDRAGGFAVLARQTRRETGEEE